MPHPVPSCYLKYLFSLTLVTFLQHIAVKGQAIEPVISESYLRKIRTGSSNDTTATDSSGVYHIKDKIHSPWQYPHQRLMMKRNGKELSFYPIATKKLTFTGSFSTVAEIKRANRQPALQQIYAQGRSNAGILIWQGPETGNIFSYGPQMNTLQYDGTSYMYDQNGRLVPAQTQAAAQPYNNSILRTGALISNSFNCVISYDVNGLKKLEVSLHASQVAENTFIKYNSNTSGNGDITTKLITKPADISFVYRYNQSRFTNNNRNGFLNRAYEASLLTPVSFDAKQGTTLENGQQRSFSTITDNPYFLLQHSPNAFFQDQHNLSLKVSKNIKDYGYNIAQSFEKGTQTSNEGYKPGSAFFENGVLTKRIKTDQNYYLNSYFHHIFRYPGYYRFTTTATLNFNYADSRTNINYSGYTNYAYERKNSDVILKLENKYEVYKLKAYVQVQNNTYISNTATKNSYFLPNGSGYIDYNVNGYNIKLVSVFYNYKNEMPVNQSFSQFGLTRLNTSEATHFFPITEVAGFNNITPIGHHDWEERIEILRYNKIDFTGAVFLKQTTNDIFPVYDNNQLVLKNIASHNTRGAEITASNTLYTLRNKNLFIRNTVSFLWYRNKVTSVADGSNYTPVAGFSDVYKAIVKDEPMGVIVGSTYTRNASGEKIIGNDGYPIVSTQPTVIGNPTPDFVLKIDHTLTWKTWTLNINWEWKKGGDVWNGTQAVLDYYGRSQNSADQRSTTGYVFDGVLENGQKNTIPVTFYDPTRPVTENRWVRYGYSGVAADYIQKGSHLRINTISLSRNIYLQKNKKNLVVSASANNIFIWTAYKGADPNQLLYDINGSTGLDYFNLPSTTSYALKITFKI